MCPVRSALLVVVYRLPVSRTGRYCTVTGLRGGCRRQRRASHRDKTNKDDVLQKESTEPTRAEFLRTTSMSVNGDSSDDSDEWAQDDLPNLPPQSASVPPQNAASSLIGPPDDGNDDDDDDEGWESKLTPAFTKETSPKDLKASSKSNETLDEGYPMLLVDMTQLSDEAIHSKFDANAVNDPEAVRRLRLQLERDYESTRTNTTWIANGTVVPCGSSVWRPALERLRRQHQGHHFCPIFPPKSTANK